MFLTNNIGSRYNCQKTSHIPAGSLYNMLSSFAPSTKICESAASSAKQSANLRPPIKNLPAIEIICCNKRLISGDLPCNFSGCLKS